MRATRLGMLGPRGELGPGPVEGLLPPPGLGGGASGRIAMGGLTVVGERRVSPAVLAVGGPLTPFGPGEELPGASSPTGPRAPPVDILKSLPGNGR
jgi:hypothetical protein